VRRTATEYFKHWGLTRELTRRRRRILTKEFSPTPAVGLNELLGPLFGGQCCRYFLEGLVARLGQHIGQGPGPRNLCPRLQVFQPLFVADEDLDLAATIFQFLPEMEIGFCQKGPNT